MTSISFVIPILNEEAALTKQSSSFQALIKEGHEIIAVDAGSFDASVAIAENIGCVCLNSKASRGLQLHIGAEKCSNDIIVFLHADTQLPKSAVQSILNTLSANKKYWGRFDVAFTNSSLVFKTIAWFMNRRSCITAVVTGDHTLFIKRETYFALGGFANIPLMEDVELSKRLKKHSRPACLKDTVITSSRKWETNGILKTVLSMWRFRLLFYFGASPEKLAKQYYK